MQTVSDWNPVTEILTATRQGFVGDISWADTWPGLVAIAVLLTVLFGLALSRLARFGEAAHS
jgi:hypothetical protein